jgi:putative ABC transport system permease protein
VSLSVAQRLPGFALLGVLGMTAGERRRVVLLECAGLGMAGSALGLVAGAGLAAAALRWMAGDLGGGYFPGVTPSLQWSPLSLVVFFALGTAAAVAGGWLPARAAERLQPARALKGLSSLEAPAGSPAPALALIAAGVMLAFAAADRRPAAGRLCGGGAAALRRRGAGAVVRAAWLLARWPLPASALPRLALQRASFHRQTATAAVAGVVAALALSAALTVMVTSFRVGVGDWLDTLLPADLYARSRRQQRPPTRPGSPPDFVARRVPCPAWRGCRPADCAALPLAAGRPPVVLIARDIGNPAQTSCR